LALPVRALGLTPGAPVTAVSYRYADGRSTLVGRKRLGAWPGHPGFRGIPTDEESGMKKRRPTLREDGRARGSERTQLVITILTAVAALAGCVEQLVR
jgi:hypothetical protein